MKLIKTISVLAAAASALGIVAWLVLANLVPGGTLNLRWRPDDRNAFVGPLVPESRLSSSAVAHDGTPYRTVTAEPVNFNVRVPLAFANAKVTVVAAGDPAVLEIGGLASRATWTYDLRPGLNSVIDDLGWDKTVGQGLTLYQRERKYADIGSFLAAAPLERTASYRAAAAFPIRLEGYRSSPAVHSYSAAFRGATSIKAYLANETLNFAFQVQEVNRHAGADGFEAAAYLDGERIARAVWSDDGNSSGDGKLSGLRQLRLYTEKPVTGVVRLDLPAGDDVVFRETATSQQKFVFLNRFYAADNVGYSSQPAAFAVVTDGSRLAATTSHPEAFQTLRVGGQTLAIDDINRTFTLRTAEEERRQGSAEIVSGYGDLRLETAGVFAFGRDNLFRADPRPLTWETDVDKDGIDYVLTSYVSPPRTEWRTATADFDLARLSLVDRAYNFVISLPGLEAQDQEVRLAAIDITLTKPPPRFKDLWALLTSWL